MLPQLGRTASTSGIAFKAPSLTRSASQSQLAISPFDNDSELQIQTSKNCDHESNDWPLNNGCNSDIVTRVTLSVGTVVDRFGRLEGEFFSPKGEIFRNRSLKQIKNNPDCKTFYNKKFSKNNKYTARGNNDDWRLINDYNVLKVLKPLDVVSCTAAPAFDQPGGAIQYWVPRDLSKPFALKPPPDNKPDNKTIQQLINEGYLELLDKQDPPMYEGGFIKRKRKSRKNRKRKSIKRKSIKRKNK